MECRARPSSAETTALLAAARKGEARAADLLFGRLYDELRRLSGAYVAAEAHGATLSATDLVHEAYLKLISGGDWADRAHFMAIAARAMRQILTDRARARRAAKRGGEARAVTLDPDLLGAPLPGSPSDAHEQVLAVDAALERLSARDEDLGRLVELRFFGGLEVREVAEVTGVSERTAARQWARAKAHLLAELA
jgi:RNA polymerase sigma factor (TIGR02999 family)